MHSAPGLGRLLALAWPIVISRSSQVVVGITDALMVAPLGEAALAATTAGGLNLYAVLILPMGTVFIVSTFASQLFGEGDLEGARRHGFYGLMLAIAATVACLIGVAIAAPILALLPYADDVRRDMTTYLEIRLLSGGAAIGIEALANYYGGLGNTRLPMRANLVAMTLNVFGNWVLIGGNLGVPALGVAGAAWASALATLAAFAGLLVCFLRDRHAGHPIVPRLHLAEIKRMLRYGLPSGFNWFLEFFAFSVFVNITVAGLGTTSLAALMAVMQVNSLSFMPAFGIASAGAILVGQSIGAARKDDVPAAVRLTFLTSAVWQGLVGIVYLCIPALLFAPFARGEEAAPLLEVGTRMLMLSAAWQLSDSAATTLAEALRAAGDTAFTLWARVVLAWGIFTPGAFLTIHHLGWGDVGVVAWMTLYLSLLAATLAWRFRNGAWRRFRLTERLVC